MPQRFEDEVTFVDAVDKRPLEHTVEGLYEIEVKAMPRNVFLIAVEHKDIRAKWSVSSYSPVVRAQPRDQHHTVSNSMET